MRRRSFARSLLCDTKRSFLVPACVDSMFGDCSLNIPSRDGEFDVENRVLSIQELRRDCELMGMEKPAEKGSSLIAAGELER